MNVNTVNSFKKTGDCEVCDSVGVPVHLMHHNMWMCVPCRDAENQIMEQTHAAKQLIESSRQVDASVQVIPHIILAKSVGFVELEGAIQADSTIPDSEKDYALVKEIQTRVEHFQSVVMNHRKALNDAENELRMWQINGQSVAGKLRADIREQFKSFDINYVPSKPKTVKSPTTSSGPKASKFSKEDLKAAALKYGLDASIIRMIAVKRNCSADEAGQMLSGSSSK